MTPKEWLERAIEYAAERHAGQVDKQGKPYIAHCVRVMMGVDGLYDRVAAVLHDVVEDTDATIEEVRHFFGDAVADVVEAVTKVQDESYEDYIKRIVKFGPSAVLIKRADIKDNLLSWRLVTLPGDQQRRLIDKYMRAELLINELLELSQ